MHIPKCVFRDQLPLTTDARGAICTLNPLIYCHLHPAGAGASVQRVEQLWLVSVCVVELLQRGGRVTV